VTGRDGLRHPTDDLPGGQIRDDGRVIAARAADAVGVHDVIVVAEPDAFQPARVVVRRERAALHAQHDAPRFAQLVHLHRQLQLAVGGLAGRVEGALEAPGHQVAPALPFRQARVNGIEVDELVAGGRGVLGQEDGRRQGIETGHRRHRLIGVGERAGGQGDQQHQQQTQS